MTIEGLQHTHQHSLRALSVASRPIYQVKCSLTFWDIFWHTLGWSLLSIATLGIGFFIAPYSLARKIADNTVIIGQDKCILYPHTKSTLRSDFTVGEIIGWVLVCYLSVGWLLPFFYIAVHRRVFNSVQVYASIKSTVMEIGSVCSLPGIYQNNCTHRCQIVVNQGDTFPPCPICQNSNTTWLLLQPVVNEDFTGTEFQ